MSRWPKASLEEACSFLNGGTPSTKKPDYFTGHIPWITSADITDCNITPARSYITKEAIAESATNKVPPGTVLLVTRTGVGKVAVAQTELCFSQDITAIVPARGLIDTRYLVHFLRTKEAYFKENARGATIKGVTREVLDSVHIPLPSLAEQRRIAAILDKADAIRRKRQETIRLTEEFLRSAFLDMFGDPVANPKGWILKSAWTVIKKKAGMRTNLSAFQRKLDR